MFILGFIICLTLTQWWINFSLKIDVENPEYSKVTKKDSIIIIVCLLLSILSQVLVPLFLPFKFSLIVLLIYFLAIFLILFTVAFKKKERIEAERLDYQTIYEIIQPIVDKKKQGLDFNNPHFTIKYSKKEMSQIDIEVDPFSYKEDVISLVVNQINKFLNYKCWVFEPHLSDKYISIVGQEIPPNYARWKGSWLQPLKWMPIGVSGGGELAMQPDKTPKDLYHDSQYMTEDGTPIPANKKATPTPHFLVVGSSGGGKSLQITQELW